MKKMNTDHRKKITPKVHNGMVLNKHNHRLTPSYWTHYLPVTIIDRFKPGPGFRHFLKKRDIFAFIELLPDWDVLAQGLDAIVLVPGDSGTDGWYDHGVIAICAWERDMWRKVTPDYYVEHKEIFERLKVEGVKQSDGYLCKFNVKSIQAFQLLHVLLHELGHHYDRMTTKSKREASRGEPFAEQYCTKYEQTIWDSYLSTFGL